MKKIMLLVVLSLCLIRCAPMNGVLKNSMVETRSATVKVAENLNWGIDSAKSGFGDTIKFQSKYGSIGYMLLQDSIDFGTKYQTSIYPYSLTSVALEKFFVEATKQEIEIKKGQISPHTNNEKKYGSLIGRDLISPAWGTNYALGKNIFYPVWIRNTLVSSYALTDVISFALIAHSGITRNSNELISGIIIAGIFRILGMTSIIYAADYNRHTYLQYNFDKISLNF